MPYIVNNGQVPSLTRIEYIAARHQDWCSGNFTRIFLLGGIVPSCWVFLSQHEKEPTNWYVPLGDGNYTSVPIIDVESPASPTTSGIDPEAKSDAPGTLEAI